MYTGRYFARDVRRPPMSDFWNSGASTADWSYYSKLIIIHGLVQIPPTNYLQPSLNTMSRKNHNYTYQQCSTRTNYLKYSFFPYTTVVWNNLPYQLVSSPSVISSFKTSAHQGVAWCSLVFNVLTLSYFSYTFLYSHSFNILYIYIYVNMFLLTHAHKQHLGSTQALSD